MLRWLPILVALSGAVTAAPVNLAWDPVEDSRLTGYELGWSGTEGAYGQYQSAAGTTATLDLAEPGPWHIAVRALGDDSGAQIQSGWSSAVVWLADAGGPTVPLSQIGLWARRVTAGPSTMTTFVDSSVRMASAAANTWSTNDELNVATGDILIVKMAWEDTSATVTFSDTAGNTYTGLTVRSNGGNYQAIGYCLNATANSANIITASLSASVPYRHIEALQFRPTTTGIATLDAENYGTGTGTSMASGSINATGSDIIVVGGAKNYTNGTFTNEKIGGVTATAFDDGQLSGVWYRLLTAGESGITATATGANAAWVANIISIKIGDGATASVVPVLMRQYAAQWK